MAERGDGGEIVLLTWDAAFARWRKRLWSKEYCKELRFLGGYLVANFAAGVWTDALDDRKRDGGEFLGRAWTEWVLASAAFRNPVPLQQVGRTFIRA